MWPPPVKEAPIRTELIAAIREFTGAILNPFDLDELLNRLMTHTIEVMDASGAGIMLAGQDDKLDFVAASDQLVVDVEREQARLEQGACYSAFSANEVVRIPDISAEDRWPDYTALVLERGFRSVLGVPLNAFGQTIGVINIYRDTAGTWTDDDLTCGQIIAAMGAGYIVNTNQLRAQHTLAEQLHAAIDSRDLIGQAKGIVMAQAGVGSDEAFELLRKRSQAENRKLRDLAQELVDQQGRDRNADLDG